MKFADFLVNENLPITPPPAEPTISTKTQIISTSFQGADDIEHPIQVETVVTYSDDTVTSIQPIRVKYNDRLVPYDLFLYAIPPTTNQSLFNVNEHLSDWTSWLD